MQRSLVHIHCRVYVHMCRCRPQNMIFLFTSAWSSLRWSLGHDQNVCQETMTPLSTFTQTHKHYYFLEINIKYHIIRINSLNKLRKNLMSQLKFSNFDLLRLRYVEICKGMLLKQSLYYDGSCGSTTCSLGTQSERNH